MTQPGMQPQNPYQPQNPQNPYPPQQSAPAGAPQMPASQPTPPPAGQYPTQQQFPQQQYAPQMGGQPSAPSAGFKLNFSDMPTLMALIGLVSSLFILLGSFGTWASVSFMGFSKSVSGTEGGDGWITLFMALIAAGVLGFFLSPQGRKLWWLPIISAVSGLIAALLVLLNMANASGKLKELTSDVKVDWGWGLWLILLFGLALAATSGFAAFKGYQASKAQRPTTMHGQPMGQQPWQNQFPQQ